MRPRNEELPLAEEIRQAEDTLHVLKALARAIDDPRLVLDVILEARDTDDARAALGELLGLDELQANAVMDMQFRRVAPDARARIRDRRAELEDQLAFLRGLEG